MVVFLGAAPKAFGRISPNPAPLFSKATVIQATLKAPLGELFAQRLPTKDLEEIKKARVGGTLTIGKDVIPTQISMRGVSTLSGCSFPKLTLRFKVEDTNNTVLNGLKKLDLGTHCEPVLPETKEFFKAMDFNHREALIYNWMEILGVASYSARAADVTYIDTSKVNPRKPHTKSAFFLEDMKSVLERLNATEVESLDDLSAHPEINRYELARAEVFTQFVGDFDRHIEGGLWNYRLIALPNGTSLIIPMDFNLAAVAKGTAVSGFELDGSVFEGLKPAVRIRILREYALKKAELKASLDLLKDDPEGYTAFSQTLESQQEHLDAMIRSAEAEFSDSKPRGSPWDVSY